MRTPRRLASSRATRPGRSAHRQFHQHFNTSAEPARYLAIVIGSLRYPTIADKKATWLGMDLSVTDGGRQVDVVTA